MSNYYLPAARGGGGGGGEWSLLLEGVPHPQEKLEKQDIFSGVGTEQAYREKGVKIVNILMKGYLMIRVLATWLYMERVGNFRQQVH